VGELEVGIYSEVALAVVGGVVLSYLPKIRPAARRRQLNTVTAAAMAYGFYVAAALVGGAAFPRFLRDHLFDGLVPAAVVGVLVDRFIRSDPPTSTRRFRSLLSFFSGGAAIFGAIAAAAVFSSGTDAYLVPLVVTSVFGGTLFVSAYVSWGSENEDSVWRWLLRRPPSDPLP
jgi:hypothetical protein